MSALVLPLALTRDNLAHYVSTLIDVYIVLTLIRILMSWIPRVPYYRLLDAVLTFIREVTDPFLNLFRRFIPALRVGGGALDLSPMVAVFVLVIVGGIVVRLIQG